MSASAATHVGTYAGTHAAAAAASENAAAAAAAAPQTAQQRTADAIQSIMFGGAFDGAAWRQVESFASEKAREMRTERLKRGSRDAQSSATPTHPQPRKILKVKRRQ